MAPRQVIQLMENKHISHYVPNGHKLVPHGRLAWLHRLLWRALLKLGAIKVSIEETIKVVRVPLDEEALFNRIRSTLDYLHARGRKPSEVLMGPNTFSELMASPEARDFNGPFSFDTTYHLDRKLYGLKVEVLPQMEGILVR